MIKKKGLKINNLFYNKGNETQKSKDRSANLSRIEYSINTDLLSYPKGKNILSQNYVMLK